MTDDRAGIVQGIHAAEAELSSAEASLRLVEARLSLTDAAMARVRLLGARLGLCLTSSKTPAVTANGTNIPIPMKTLVQRTGVSERTCAKIRKAMTEGVHFHRVGSRVLFHDPQAVEFVEQWSMKPRLVEVGQALNDDVLRRRAKVALKRARQ